MTHYKGQTGTSMSLQRRPKRPKGWIEPSSEWAIEYKCLRGHTRIEREKLKGDLPLCTTCHMTIGEMNRMVSGRKVKVATLRAKGRSTPKKKEKKKSEKGPKVGSRNKG